MSLGGKHALEGMREAGPYIGLGFQLFAAILLFTGGGYWLDTQFGTLPGLTLVGVLVSFGVILFLILRIAGSGSASSGAGADGAGAASSDDPAEAEAGRSRSAPSSSGRSDPSSGSGPDFHAGHTRRVSRED